MASARPGGGLDPHRSVLCCVLVATPVRDEGHCVAGQPPLVADVATDVGHRVVGMLFLVPGVEETLRVNGRAAVTTDPVVLERVAIDGVHPKVALVVTVDECFIHCAKALRRSGVWDPGTWVPPAERPSAAAAVIVDQYQLDVAPAAIEAELEAGYRATMWDAGGQVGRRGLRLRARTGPPAPLIRSPAPPHAPARHTSVMVR